jgi:hypothetical protein
MTARYAWIALAAAGAFGLAACKSDNVAPASSGPVEAEPATASAPNAAPQGSNSSGQPVRPRSWAYPPETPPLPPGSP